MCRANFVRIFISVLSVLSFSNLGHTEQLIKPHTFVSGTPARASQVNENFDILYEQINRISSEVEAIKLSTMKNAYTSARACFTDYPMATLTLDDLKQCGFRYAQDVITVTIISGNQNDLLITSSHIRSDKIYFVSWTGYTGNLWLFKRNL